MDTTSKVPEHKYVIVVLPAYNAEKTLLKTYNDIPKDAVDKIILVDDKSADRTIAVARQMGIEYFLQQKIW